MDDVHYYGGYALLQKRVDMATVVPVCPLPKSGLGWQVLLPWEITRELQKKSRTEKKDKTSLHFSSESLRGVLCRRCTLRDWWPVALAALSAGCLVSWAFVARD